MNFLDLNNNGKTDGKTDGKDGKDGQVILAYVFAAVGIFLLVTAFFFHPIATIDITIQSSAGMLFSFCAALLGLDYHYSHLLQKTIADMQNKNKEEAE